MALGVLAACRARGISVPGEHIGRRVRQHLRGRAFRPHHRLDAAPPAGRRSDAGGRRRAGAGDAARISAPTGISPGHPRIIGTPADQPVRVAQRPRNSDVRRLNDDHAQRRADLAPLVSRRVALRRAVLGLGSLAAAASGIGGLIAACTPAAAPAPTAAPAAPTAAKPAAAPTTAPAAPTTAWPRHGRANRRPPRAAAAPTTAPAATTAPAGAAAVSDVTGSAQRLALLQHGWPEVDPRPSGRACSTSSTRRSTSSTSTSSSRSSPSVSSPRRAPSRDPTCSSMAGLISFRCTRPARSRACSPTGTNLPIKTSIQTA